MSTFFIVCDKCHAEVDVDPPKESGFRLATCKNCNSDLTFESAEVKMRPGASHDLIRRLGN